MSFGRSTNFLYLPLSLLSLFSSTSLRQSSQHHLGLLRPGPLNHTLHLPGKSLLQPQHLGQVGETKQLTGRPRSASHSSQATAIFNKPNQSPCHCLCRPARPSTSSSLPSSQSMWHYFSHLISCLLPLLKSGWCGAHPRFNRVISVDPGHDVLQ